VKLAVPAAQGSVGILHSLLSVGWRLERGGEIVYLRKGDVNYEWHAEPEARRDGVLVELAEKAAAGEPLGVVLLYGDGDVGGDATISADALELSPSIDRRLLDCGVTDVSWYVDRLAPAFRRHRVVEWRWKEVLW
jgi:hypothetical protein